MFWGPQVPIPKRFQKRSSKKSFFGLQSQIFLKNCEWWIVYFKLKGRKKSLKGSILAMSEIDYFFTEFDDLQRKITANKSSHFFFDEVPVDNNHITQANINYLSQQVLQDRYLWIACQTSGAEMSLPGEWLRERERGFTNFLSLRTIKHGKIFGRTTKFLQTIPWAIKLKYWVEYLTILYN